jgi:hypothetical protein
MLNHTILRTRDGRYQVVYETPGCNVPTPVCSCLTEAQAVRESERLNQEQVGKELALAEERRLRDQWRIRSQTISAGEIG